ncbi:putative ferric-chelate reductase 1 [Porites lutea]|uniref:putative ferric-chelate reductase 1 n=1 Tax=Porites lutea TaxID=51062 RepID=UPI003CC6D1F4
MRLVLEVAFLLVLGMSQAWGYSSGPPLSKCETVLPVHDENKPQSGASPYSISVSNSSYTTGGNLTVTIKGSGSKKFKGFILQARGSDSSVAWPIGEFTEIPADGAQVLFCAGGDLKSTAAHKNPNKTEWSSLQFTWTAPAQSAGNITFIATIVEKFDTFWRKIESSVVTGPPAENVTRGEASQSFQVSLNITKDGCGETKSCYSEPEDCEGGSDCSYLVTIKPVKGGDGQGEVTEVEFEISSKKQWASIGFNTEKKMGGTDALICENINGQVSVEHYVADKGYGTPTKSNPKPSSLVQLSQKSEGGIISCQFKRNMKDPDMIDLTEPLYLVYASGPISGDTIGKHPPSPNTSPQKVEVAEVVVLTGEKKDSTLMKAHGCLMVIAWIGFASIGIFMARFTRVAFGDKELLGTKVWFTFHRILMISTVLVTIVGIILIFVYAGHWMPGAHPITGIIVLVLSVIQPIAAAFRPHPEDDNRYLFNWAHRAGGIFALILAVVTVFLGICIYKDELGLDNSPLYAMIVYCVGVAFVIAFDIYLSCKKRDHKTASFTMTGEKEAMKLVTVDANKPGGGHVQVEQSEGELAVSLRRLMLGFSVLLVTGIVIALVVLIAVAEAGGEGHDH